MKNFGTLKPPHENFLRTPLRPMFEPEVFRKQMYSVEGSICDIVGIFPHPHSHWAPHSDSAPGELCHLRHAPVAT